MVARESIHIGHPLACQLRHQVQDPRLVTIYLRPYITRLACGLGLIDRYTGMRHVGGIQSLGITTL